VVHYGELDWAAGFGVEAGLVRVSVGMEDKEDLLKLFEVAMNAAQIQHRMRASECLYAVWFLQQGLFSPGAMYSCCYQLHK
jgi:hypothetical protein